MRSKRKFSAEFKAKVALEAIREQNTVSEIAAKHQLHPNQISQWKKQFLDNSAAAFESDKEDAVSDHEAEMAKLYEQIGKLQVANEFLKKKLS
jgi:transposase